MFCHREFIVKGDEETRADQVWFRSSCFGVQGLGSVGSGSGTQQHSVFSRSPR